LRETLGDPPTMPSALIDFDPTTGGASYQNDSGFALAEIRRQLGVECPRFDLAYAMMRFKQGEGDEPLLKHSGPAGVAGEFVTEAAGEAAHGIYLGGLIVWAGKKVASFARAKFKDSALVRRLESDIGNQDFVNLLRLNAQDIQPLLSKRLGEDLEE